MHLSDECSIEQLALRVMDRTLPKSEWTHEGHFAFALWLVRHRAELTVPEAIRPLIVGYNEATHTPNTDHGGYHHTITIVSIRAARDHLSRCGPEAPLGSALATLMASRLGRSDWVFDHWVPETLFSVAARRGWVEPDRAPLGFS